jgi:hypothetical protein
MANNSIEYKTAKHIENGLADNRLAPWAFAQALRALSGPGTQERIVTSLIIPYVTVRAVDWEYGNFTQRDFEHLKFCKLSRDLARELYETEDVRFVDL